MGIYKEFLSIIFEMSISIFVMIFGYAVWDNFDLKIYNIANINDKTKVIEQVEENNVLYLHNTAKTTNGVNLNFKVDKNQFNNTNYMVLNFEDKVYNLKNLSYIEDINFYYFKIYDIEFDSYETKNFNFSIENNELLNYEFVVL